MGPCFVFGPSRLVGGPFCLVSVGCLMIVLYVGIGCFSVVLGAWWLLSRAC